MACLVSINLPISLPTSKTLIQEIHPRRQALWLSLGKAINRTANKLHAPYSCGRSLFSVNARCHLHIATPLRHFGEPIFCHFNVYSCIDTVITGFWVGPDIDDGWGFVEASVNRIL